MVQLIIRVVLVILFVGAFGAQIDHPLKGRIIGGSDAPDGSVPYMASIRFSSNNTHACGASIIGPSTILTAAHCVFLYVLTPWVIQVVVGTHTLDAGGVIYYVKDIRVHEQWSLATLKNDIAILELYSDITYSSTVAPIALETSDVADGVDALFSGWGTTTFPGVYPNILQCIRLNKISNSACLQYWPLLVDNSKVCTLNKKGEGLCHGDSGGPLVAYGKQFGIASVALPCAQGFPDIYTKISYFLDWIEENST